MISEGTRRAGPYTSNGVQTAFAFAFKVLAEADVVVTLTSTLGAEAVAVLTTEYTVTLNPDQDSDPGGEITMLTAPDGPSVTITSGMVIEQPDIYTNTGGFYPRVLNDSLDRVTINVQQLDERLGRTPQRPLDPSALDGAIPVLSSDGSIAWSTAVDFEGPTGPVGPAGASGNIVGLFGDIATSTVDAALDIIQTTGFSTIGIGAATYINDAAATSTLAAAYPLCCVADAGGRYWRLHAGGAALTPEMVGAVGTPGVNDQPKIRQLLTYGTVSGYLWWDFPKTYELWRPAQVTTEGLWGPDIAYLAIQGTKAMITGRAGQGTFILKNTVGANNTTIGAGATYRARAIGLMPGTFAPGQSPTTTMEWFIQHNISVDGTFGYAGSIFNWPAAGSDVRHKGFAAQDATINYIETLGCIYKDFGGEVYYVGGAGIGEQLVVDSVFRLSPQCAFNPGGSGSKIVARNVQAGESYQAIEGIMGLDATFDNCRFYDFYSSGATGGPDPDFAVGYPFNFPTRSSVRRPPLIHYKNCRFEGASDSFYAGSFSVFEGLTAVDCTMNIQAHARDITIRGVSICDQKSAYPAVNLSGPVDVTTQFPSAPGGVFTEPPRNIIIDIHTVRSDDAQADARYFSQIINVTGVVDVSLASAALHSISCRISGDAQTPFSYGGTVYALSRLPSTEVTAFNNTTGQPYGGDFASPTADFTHEVKGPALTIYNGTVGAWVITLGTTVAPGHGQEFTIFKGQAGGPTPVLNDGGNLKLGAATRTLTTQYGYLKLKFDKNSGRFVETGFIT